MVPLPLILLIAGLGAGSAAVGVTLYRNYDGARTQRVEVSVDASGAVGSVSTSPPALSADAAGALGRRPSSAIAQGAMRPRARGTDRSGGSAARQIRLARIASPAVAIGGTAPSSPASGRGAVESRAASRAEGAARTVAPPRASARGGVDIADRASASGRLAGRAVRIATAGDDGGAVRPGDVEAIGAAPAGADAAAAPSARAADLALSPRADAPGGRTGGTRASPRPLETDAQGADAMARVGPSGGRLAGPPGTPSPGGIAIEDLTPRNPASGPFDGGFDRPVGTDAGAASVDLARDRSSGRIDVGAARTAIAGDGLGDAGSGILASAPDAAGELAGRRGLRDLDDAARVGVPGSTARARRDGALATPVPPAIIPATARLAISPPPLVAARGGGTLEAGERPAMASARTTVLPGARLASSGAGSPSPARASAAVRGRVSFGAPIEVGARARVRIDAVEAEAARIRIRGRGRAGSTVRASLNGTDLGPVTVRDDATFALDLPARMLPGAYELQVEAGDAASDGALSGDGGATIGFVLDSDLRQTTRRRGVGAAARVTGEAGAITAKPHVVLIEDGDSLWRIARRVYGDGVSFPTIVNANRDLIGDPDLIFPGQVFVLPLLETHRMGDPLPS